MVVGEAILAALLADATVVGLVGSRIYPNLAPQGTPAPFVVFRVVSDVPDNTLTGSASSTIVNSRVQIDAYAKRYLDAHQAADAVDVVLSALAQVGLSAWREVTRDLYDNETGLHRVSADFSVFR